MTPGQTLGDGWGIPKKLACVTTDLGKSWLPKMRRLWRNWPLNAEPRRVGVDDCQREGVERFGAHMSTPTRAALELLAGDVGVR